RNVQNEIRIRRQTQPGPALARRGDAVEVAGDVEQVRDDLEMQMRPPVAVLGRRADFGEALAYANLLSDRKALERASRQVPVQREELNGLITDRAVDRMSQNDDGPVVE